MTGIVIALGLFLLVVIVMGIHHDHRHRGVRGPAGGARTTARARRLEHRSQADRWAGPGV